MVVWLKRIERLPRRRQRQECQRHNHAVGKRKVRHIGRHVIEIALPDIEIGMRERIRDKRIKPFDLRKRRRDGKEQRSLARGRTRKRARA